MTRDSLITDDWNAIVERLGGTDALDAGARAAKAFRRARKIPNAVVLLRIVLAYCLGHWSLRSTAAWAAALELADISNVALLKRLRQCETWLAQLAGELLASAAPSASQGRLIRIIDATTVAKAEREARRKNGVWRIHSAFDLPTERFGHFELTDEHGGEQLDRIPVVAGEIRIADAAHLQPDRIAAVLEQGGDVVVRGGWRNARWLDGAGQPFDLIAALRTNAEVGRIDQPVWLNRKNGPPVPVRLIALRAQSDQRIEKARRDARRAAQKNGYTLSPDGLFAAEWLLVVTSLAAPAFSTDDVLALYRLRWRIELGFKRLKSLVGLKGPPGNDPRSARAWILAHLLVLLLLEPLIGAFEVSPRWADAA
jgi:Transposase DDE domain